jgi:hypothetical protein
MNEKQVNSGKKGNTEASAGQRLLSGEAWGDFLSKLDRVGRHFLEGEFPRSAQMGALAYRHLLRLVRGATESLLECADPERPVLIRTFDLGLAYALDNPDTIYHHFLVLPGETYRLRGEPPGKGKPPHFISVSALVFETAGLPRVGVHFNNANGTLEMDAERGFELTISAEEQQSGNWLRLEPEFPHQRIIIRQVFQDWEEQRPLQLELERVEETGPCRPLSADAVALAMELIVAFVEFQSERWLRNTLEVRERGENVLPTAMENPDIAGLTGQRYAQCFYRVPDGKALLVEFRPPREYAYWGIQLTNWFGESLDYAQRFVSINSHQAVVEPDGVFRAILAAEDPGVPNWLDIGGGEAFSEGLVIVRFTECGKDAEIDVPRTRLVPVDRVRQVLPADHPRVVPEERRREMRIRRRHLMRRLGQ